MQRAHGIAANDARDDVHAGQEKDVKPERYVKKTEELSGFHEL